MVQRALSAILKTLRIDRGDERVRCLRCGADLGDPETRRGAGLERFTNPDGCVFELIRFDELERVTLCGGYYSEASFYPGYAWASSQCGSCGYFIGWHFRGESDGFFGVTTDAVDIY